MPACPYCRGRARIVTRPGNHGRDDLVCERCEHRLGPAYGPGMHATDPEWRQGYLERLQIALRALREIAALPHSPDCDLGRASACACVLATAALKELGK